VRGEIVAKEGRLLAFSKVKAGDKRAQNIKES